jgi:hypothetical protein
MVDNTQPNACARLAVLSQAPTVWVDRVLNAATLAATISPVADVLGVVHSTASTKQTAIARCVVQMARGGAAVNEEQNCV